MDADQINIGPDGSLESFVIRTAKAHINSRQHGARRADLYRTLPEKFGPIAHESRNLVRVYSSIPPKLRIRASLYGP